MVAEPTPVVCADLGIHCASQQQVDRGMLTAACFNAHSARNKSASLLEIAANFDICAFTETWHFDSADVALQRIVPPGYCCTEASRPTGGRISKVNNNWGGVAIIHKDNLRAKKLSFSSKPTTFEYAATILSSATARLVFVAIYRPGSQIMSEQFYTEFVAVLEPVAVYSCDVVLTGDFNIHDDDPIDVHAVRLNSILQSFGLVQSVVGPTHRGGHTLDLVITRSDRPRPIVAVDLPLLSDHSLVRFQLPMQRPPLQYVDVAMRAWKNFDQELFRADLLKSRLCCTADGYAGMTVDDLQGLYDAVMADLLEKHAPRRTVRRRYQPMTPWFDSDCAAARRRTRALERRYRRSKSSVDRAAWVDQARSMHRMYTWKQNTYWEQKVAESRGNSKRL